MAIPAVRESVSMATTFSSARRALAESQGSPTHVESSPEQGSSRSSAWSEVRVWLAVPLALVALDAEAQQIVESAATTDQPTAIRAWRVEPTIAVRETWTDNIGLQPSRDARSDLVTEILPGIAVRGRGARVRLDLEYQPTALIYARDSERNDFLNGLAATGVVEAIERILFVETRAQITQQSVSPFGTQSVADANSNSNRTETRIFSITPYSRGILGSWATYDLRYDATATRTADPVGVDSNARNWSARIENANPIGDFGWIIDYADSRVDFDVGQDARSSLARGTVTYRIRPQLVSFVRGGRQRNNYDGSDRNYSTHGLGLHWAPTERTRVSAEIDKQFFGTGYAYSVQHRTAQTAWNVVASKGETTSAAQLTRASAGSMFDRFSDILADQIRDPDQRANRVREVLARSSIPTQSISQAGYLSSGVFVEKRLEGSAALMGVRNTVTIAAYKRDTRQLLGAESLRSEDATSVPDVRELGATLSWNHRLSGLASFTFTSGWQRNLSAGDDGLRTVLRRFELIAQTQLGPRTDASAGLRHVRSDGRDESSAGYRENAVLVSVRHRF